jgi:hypothetical protein
MVVQNTYNRATIRMLTYRYSRFGGGWEGGIVGPRYVHYVPIELSRLLPSASTDIPWTESTPFERDRNPALKSADELKAGSLMD